MSPLESAKVLPCSEDRSCARLSYSRCASSRNFNITRARRCGLVAAHAGWAAAALAIASATSTLLAKATRACTSPVLGSNTSPARRSEEHTSELQSRRDLVCRLLLEKKKKKQMQRIKHHKEHDNNNR